MTKTAKLIYTCGPDWFYKTGIEVSDPHFLYVDGAGKSHAMVGALEYDIARERSKIDHIYSHEDMVKKLPEGEKPSLVNMIKALHGAENKAKIEVAEDFPAYLFTALIAEGLAVVAAKGLVFPERMIKTAAEIKCLHAAQQLNELGFLRAEKILAAAEIGAKNALMWGGAPLTSEILQAEINAELMRRGAQSTKSSEFSFGPIVAGGAQGAIPHERGHGQLYAHELIIIDSFPQHKNGYYGDLTRTYVKGEASEWQTKVYATVLGAQALALRLVKPEADLREIQTAVVAYFKDAGFATGVAADGSYYGYMHGIGHHIGLTVHDGAMQRQAADCILQVGHVITIEPGLYYPAGTHEGGVGGCRIEDIVVVTEDGCENLTSLAKDGWVVSL